MMVAGEYIWALLSQLYICAGPALMFGYPLYQSILAIESPVKQDDSQWLTYWVLFYTFMELGLDGFMSWIPMWYTIKLVCIAWLVLPQTRGAAYIYDTYVKTHVASLVVKVERKLNAEQKSIMAQMSPRARNTVAQYINENGTAAFDKVVQSAVHDFKKTSAESGRHWWSSHHHERSPGSPEKGEKKHWGWHHHFHHSDEHHSERKHGGWSPDSNWGWSHHFDGGM